MAVTKRAVGNGIKKGTSSSFNVPPRQTEVWEVCWRRGRVDIKASHMSWTKLR
uniref:Uncharacterized protein n=1 Tax=Parascaris equorum TaxID=6256 RepID=A0A914R3A5_PAREQ